MSKLGDLNLTVTRAWPWQTQSHVAFVCEGRMFTVPATAPFGAFLLDLLEAQLVEVPSWT